jgi:hypothetical protein
MGEVYTYNGSHLTTIRDGSVELTQMAEQGAIGSGSFAIDDTAGTQAIIGQLDFSVTQSACSFPLTFRGFIDNPSFGRHTGTDRAPDVAASRGIAATVVDLNAMASFILIDGSDGKRPAETVAARGAWLMGSDYVDFADNGRCSFPSSKGMDKADYRGQYAGDVLADMVMAATGYNHHVNDWGSGPELTFRDDNASTADTCTYRISNVLSDATSLTLNPGKDATLERRYGNVYSKIAFSSAKKTIYRERAATAAAYNGERGGTASNSNVKTDAKAAEEADSILWQHHTPEDHITLTLDGVTDAQINLIRQGMRIQAKFSHFAPEGYDSFTWFRIMERTVAPIVADGALYRLKLRLSPQEAAQPVTGIVQSAFDTSGEGGIVMHLPNPVTPGNLLVFVISDRNQAEPIAPSTDSSRERWGAGAWTRFPNTRVSNGVGPTHGDGVALWYKTADSTEQDGYIAVTTAVVGIFELSNMNIGSATEVHKLDQASAATMTIGSLGTAATGTVAIMVGNVEHGSFPLSGDVLSWVPGAGWTTDRVSPAYYGGAILWNSPLSYVAHALGAGAALTASGTRSALEDGTGQWCGLAVLIPPV